MARPKIICVAGRTCAGKDTLTSRAILNANIELSEGKYDYPFKQVVSYTTRPKRESEKDGREHFFVTEDEYYEIRDDHIITETTIGDYHYWTTTDQLMDDINNGIILVYIIDPIGITNLLSGIVTHRLGNDFSEEDIYTIYITADPEERLTRFINRQYKGIVSSKAIKEFKTRSMNENDQFDDFETCHLDEIDLLINTTKKENFVINHTIMTSALINLYKKDISGD